METLLKALVNLYCGAVGSRGRRRSVLKEGCSKSMEHVRSIRKSRSNSGESYVVTTGRNLHCGATNSTDSAVPSRDR
eukprot:scaffold1314_cov386-Pavlova_lutheri.AAC.22